MKTKQRNEVKGSTKKLFLKRRRWSKTCKRKAPLFVGGGVAHGPKELFIKLKK